MRAFRAVSGILSESRQDKSTARLALVIVGHLLFAFTTATFGIFGRRVDAVAHALHTLFECAALVFCLLSMLNSVTHGTTTSYSFGTQRLEVLSAFCVAIVNLFFALFAGGEGIVHYVTALVPVLHAEKVDSKAHELLKHHDHEHLHTTVLQFGRVGLALFSVVLLFRPAFARALSEHDSHSFVSLNARELNIRAAFIHCVSVLVRAIAAPLASTCGDWNFPGVEVSIILLSTALCVLLNWKLCRATTLILSQVLLFQTGLISYL
jgi:Co/Zn/Cd efflux system component